MLRAILFKARLSLTYYNLGGVKLSIFEFRGLVLSTAENTHCDSVVSSGVLSLIDLCYHAVAICEGGFIK